MLGLYIHVPFCSAICNYCNFNRGLFDEGLKARYVDALETEIARSRQQADGDGEREVVDTIYFGGGTPSLLEPAEIGRVVNACAREFDVTSDAEISLEANPESVNERRLAGFREAGVNRLSYGVQSFREAELRRLSRLHTADRAAEAVGDARAAGFDNVSLDLMMWLPGQQVPEWLESVDRAIALNPEHLSLYLLEVYPNAPLKEEMARANWSQAPDDDAATMYLAAMGRLDAVGYRQYEISNVARSGRQSRHNLKYWQDGEWMGFGCGAHSTRRAVRWRNVASTEEYVQRLRAGESPAVDHQWRTTEGRLGDALFTGLRLTEGVNLDAIRSIYGVDVWDRYGGQLEPFLQTGILRRDGCRISLTREGMLLAHEVMSIFV
ncbi:MAG TPA: radical SAM family heme chaperone HemW [Vicinamibacterales bacterium]|jgi:oxygen-independent coproporphyrinogen-3 oxidase|nr:radical SAM family heme chaperone HemW [Vicinamibacterales bacterium]